MNSSYINRFDSALRAAVLCCVLVIVYAGPASIFGLEEIFGDDLGGVTEGTDWMTWVGFVGLFAFPLVLAFKWWNTNPSGSTMALGVYLTLMLLIWIVTRSFGLMIMTVAIAAPFQPGNINDSTLDPFYYTALSLTVLVCIAIPIAAIAFQISRRDYWDKLQY